MLRVDGWGAMWWELVMPRKPRVEFAEAVYYVMSQGRLILGVVLAAALFSGCASLRHVDDSWWAGDKAQHFAVCGLAGAATALAAKQNDLSDGRTFLLGVGVAVGLGVGKETYDARIKRTYFSGKDLVWDLAGGAVGSLVVIGLNE